MNISYNWLKRYLATDLSAEEIARILTDIGLEVEGFEKIETIRGGLRASWSARCSPAWTIPIRTTCMSRRWMSGAASRCRSSAERRTAVRASRCCAPR